MAYPNIDPLDWSTVQPHVDGLLAEELTVEGARSWLQNWSDLASVLYEGGVRVQRRIAENTADAEGDAQFRVLVGETLPKARMADQALRNRLLALRGYEPTDEIREMLRRFRTEASIHRDENLPLISQAMRLENDYSKITGGMAVDWDGAAETMPQVMARLRSPDRSERQRAWSLATSRFLQDRERLNDLFLEMLPLRRTIAHNAGLPDYRAYKWLELARFDYSPGDCTTFHTAIEQVVVPFACQIIEALRSRLGIDSIRPWDTEVDPYGEPLHPFTSSADLQSGVHRMVGAVHPRFASHFEAMQPDYLDLESRPNKAPGAYCDGFPVAGKPYVFMNAVGSGRDVETLLHESGHAFHFMESRLQPLIWNHNGPMEFCEVASMGMELLSAPYLAQSRGGFYTAEDARRAYAGHLRQIVGFLPYMAVVDAFQQWIYVEAPDDVSAAHLDSKWSELWDRFMPFVDYSGLETEKATGWHRKLHIFQAPLYYIEYGLAQLGALQVWRNAQDDRPRAVEDYRRALALGNTRSLKDLFEAAGARFAFDRATVEGLMGAVERKLAELAD